MTTKPFAFSLSSSSSKMPTTTKKQSKNQNHHHFYKDTTPKSCDTFIAFGTNNRVIFGKNSDRPAGEGQSIRRYPGRQWYKENDPNTTNGDNNINNNNINNNNNNNVVPTVKCTYISIPQAPTTHAVLISQIDWMWGAEHGTNEHGVVIGNEAVWTQVEGEDLSTKRLLGMDLVRLGLERGTTAYEALTHITTLLERHGQGGPCAENDSSFTYHNSFLIGDSTEAWILETAGRQWVAKRYTSGSRNISNTLTIRTDYDLHSKGLLEYAKTHQLLKKKKTTKNDDDDNDYGNDDKLDWAATFGEGAVEECTSRYSRQSCGRILLEKKLLSSTTTNGNGDEVVEMTATDMMEILRDHDSGICMHGGFETTASMVSELSKDVKNFPHTHWMMDTPHPCQNEYKIQPVVLSSENKT